MRFCKPCGNTKPLTEFNVDAKESGGHRYYCKACAKEKKRVYLLKRADMGQIDHKKVFAAGYYKGLSESANQLNEEQMNISKFESVYRGLSAQAKKVYESLPISEPWSPSQIMQELHRKNISMSDMRVVMGCINSLIDAGCVDEPSKGMFIRAEIKEKQAPNQTFKTIKQKDTEMQKETKPENTTNPIDRLSTLASRLRALATDMDDAAISLAEQAQKNDAETVKMRQLQALLKSLG